MKMLRQFLFSESGAAMVEYGLIGALISIGAITAMNSLGSAFFNSFSSIASRLNELPIVR